MVWVCASLCRLCCLDRPLRVRLPAPQMAHLKTNTFPVPRGPKGNGACFITVNRQALVPFSLSAKQSNRSPSLRNPNNQHQEGKILRNLWAQNQNLDASTCICTLHCHCEHVKSFWFSTSSSVFPEIKQQGNKVFTSPNHCKEQNTLDLICWMFLEMEEGK